MANELDEVTGPVNKEGRDINVIDKQLTPKTGAGCIVVVVLLWILGIIPGIIFTIIYFNKKSKLEALQQKVNSAASTIDNFLEQRVQILQNAAGLLGKAIDLDKTVFAEIAKARGGMNEKNAKLDKLTKDVKVAFEAYPDLKAHSAIEDCMQKNDYLQREITAARELYNDVVNEWNSTIYQYLAYRMIASKKGYTTRIPFTASAETKAAARGKFF